MRVSLSLLHPLYTMSSFNQNTISSHHQSPPSPPSQVLAPTRGFIPFRQFNIPSRDFGEHADNGSDMVGCVTAVLNLQVCSHLIHIFSLLL